MTIMYYPHSPGLRPHRTSRTNLAVNYMPPVRPLPPRVAPRAVTPKVAPEDPYLAQARLMASALLDPQVSAANRAAEQAQRDSLARAQAYAGVTSALGEYTKGLPEAVRSAYQTAANDVSGYAQGITGAAGENSRAAAAEAAARIAQIGSPGLPSPTADPNYENTVAYTGGLIPARELAGSAASAFTEMSGLRTASGLAMAQAAQKQAQTDSAAVAELRQKAVDLEGTRAGEVAKQLLALHDEARQQQSVDIQQSALRVQQGQLRLSQAKTAQDQAAAMSDITGTVWVVRNGRAVDTGKAAPGTTGYKALHPGSTQTPSPFQHTTIGKHPVTFNPNTGAYTDPSTQATIPQATIDKWLKEAKAAAASGGSQKGFQHSTINGVSVVFDPNTGNTYLAGDMRHPLSSDELKKLKNTSPAAIQQSRAQARTGIATVLQGTAKIKAQPKAKPEDILRLLVAQGVPNWIAVQALLAEAPNHKGQVAWENFQKNWGR